MEISVANQRFAYDEAGQGRPVVLLHAFPVCREMWRPQLADLGRDYRVLALDQRGFGGSGGGAASVEVLADDVAGFLDALGVREPVVVGGLSMGGYVALAFARRHAGRLAGLILADTRAEADTAEARANRDKNIALVREKGPGALVDQMVPKLLGPTTQAQRPEVVAEVRRMGLAQTAAGIIGALEGLRDRPDATPALGQIRVPTLVLVGEEDGLTPPNLAEKLQQGIPQATLTRIPGAGHLSNLEQPAAFNAAVRAFLGRVWGTP